MLGRRNKDAEIRREIDDLLAGIRGRMTDIENRVNALSNAVFDLGGQVASMKGRVLAAERYQPKGNIKPPQVEGIVPILTPEETMRFGRMTPEEQENFIREKYPSLSQASRKE